MKKMLFSLVLCMLFFSSCANGEEIKHGKYVTDDGFAWVELQDNNEFVFNRSIATSYDPTGSYSIKDGKLTLHVTDDEEYIFSVINGELIFESGIMSP